MLSYTFSELPGHANFFLKKKQQIETTLKEGVAGQPGETDSRKLTIAFRRTRNWKNIKQIHENSKRRDL
jgi:hypothetical protein